MVFGGDHRATLAPSKIAFFVVANVGKPEEGKDGDRKHQQKYWVQERHACPKNGKQNPQPPSFLKESFEACHAVQILGGGEV